LPLTIDRIVEKYRTMGSEATLATNLRRQGLSATTIKKTIEDRRALVGTANEQQEKVNRFRADLMLKSRAEQIKSYLWLFSSFDRSIALWEATVDESADIFWPVFLENWCICDGLWPMRQIMRSTLRCRVAELSPIGFLSPADRDFYDALPDRMTVLRGCSRRRVRGLPWTTDRERAEFFARGGRLGRQPDPVIACAEIAKADIFFVSTGRDESEVVLDPYSIKRLRLESAVI